MGVTEGHPSPFTIVCTLTDYYNITTIDIIIFKILRTSRK